MYSAEISRANPTCFVFLLDQSGSMEDRIGGGEESRKCDVVADALNRLLSELAIKCAKEEGVRDYFHVAVVGYGVEVGPALAGPLAERQLRRPPASRRGPRRSPTAPAASSSRR
jgi:hypothetical protein